jgi:MftR C-terminal domain
VRRSSSLQRGRRADRPRFLDAQTHGVELLAPLLARERGTSTDELHLRVVGSALIAAVFVALDLWQKDGGKRDLLVLLDDATDALAKGLRELQLRPRA